MIRTLAVIATLAAVASPALADVKVNVAGKDAAAIDALITSAAKTACREELRGSMTPFYAMKACIDAAKADALAKVATVRTADVSSLTRASN